MATTRRAYAGGAQSTTTTSAIASSGTTSFTITAYTGWPYGSDPFFVVVEPGTASEEKILVTRTGSTDTTINIASDSERAQDGTSAVGHSSGSVVFPVFTALDADEANELTSSWSTKGDLVSYGSSTFETLGVGSNGALLMADSGETSGLKWAQPGYTYVQTVYFTSSGTFTKATYPWLRAIRVKVQGGGGASSVVFSTAVGESSAASGGAGGTYAESFITNIAGLSASETITVGAGGAGGGGSGGAGGASSFGSLVSANGGGGGILISTSGQNISRINTAGGNPDSTATGDLVVVGGAGHYGHVLSPGYSSRSAVGGNGGDAKLGHGSRAQNASAGGINGALYGGGAGGGSNGPAQSTRNGSNGGAGIVIVELFA